MNDHSDSGITYDQPKFSADSLVQQMKAIKAKGNVHQHVDIPVATAIVLLEIASSDHIVDKIEKSVIHNGLKSIFRISDQAALGVITKAKSALMSMRSSSAEASMLKDVLDSASKNAVANVIDNLIRCNGVVDTMEIYLRNRFRSLLGLNDEPLRPRSDEQ